MRAKALVVFFLPMLLAAVPYRVRAQDPAGLTGEEEEKLRDAQDPSDRLGVYVTLEQARLDRFEELRKEPPDAKYHRGPDLDNLLGQYIALDDEMKSWIDDQYERMADMRRGLRALLEGGPRQLDELRKIQQTPDPRASAYKDSLHDAIDDLSDTLDGATKALAEQEKHFAVAKREEKAEAQNVKETVKEGKKREKEEEKLRKKEQKELRKRGVPEDPDQKD